MLWDINPVPLRVFIDVAKEFEKLNGIHKLTRKNLRKPANYTCVTPHLLAKACFPVSFPLNQETSVQSGPSSCC